MHSRAPVAAPFGADQKERAAPGHRMAEEISKSLLTSHSVVEL